MSSNAGTTFGNTMLQFSVPWIAYLCSTRWRSNLPGNASWVYGRHDQPYLYCQNGEQRNGDVFLEMLKKFRHGILLWIMKLSITHRQECNVVCLYGRSNRNSSLCWTGISMSTLIPHDRTNMNLLDAAMCIQGTANLTNCT